jgi:anti-sigma regulatory factor (Ser/Thr protein kinase)
MHPNGAGAGRAYGWRVTAFRHEALFYSGAGDFLAGTVPRIRDAVASDGAVLVAAEPERIRLVREALGGDGGGAVAFADMQRIGRNPACIMPVWRAFVRDHAQAGRPLLGVGEPVSPARSAAELVECQRHESLLNVAFDGAELTLICPYDADALPQPVLDEARRSHRLVTEDGVSRRSATYTDAVPADALPEPAAPPAELPFSRADLGLVRRFVRDFAQRAGFSSERMTDLVLAVNEVVSNSIRHAPGGAGVARAWRDRDAFVCEVSDGGWIEDPLVGREPISYDAPGGRGLWLVNHLCDLVQVRSSAAGTVVRLHMRLA